MNRTPSCAFSSRKSVLNGASSFVGNPFSSLKTQLTCTSMRRFKRLRTLAMTSIRPSSLIRAARMSGDDVARAALDFFRHFHAAGRPHEAESREEENKFISFHNGIHWLLVLVADKYHGVSRRVRH